MPTAAPYGSWESPITTEFLTGGGVVGFDGVAAADTGIFWLERRPHEGGRTVLVFRPDGGEPVDVVPRDFNVRTRVHEYGGGAFIVHGTSVWCSSFDDGRLYRFDEPGGAGQPVTPQPPQPNAWRYADGSMAPDGSTIVCVRERHDVDGEPLNELVALAADGSGGPRVLASGRDFYSSPRISPDGRRVAWTAWDHPLLPFEGTDLCVAELAADGTLTGGRRVAGGQTESVTQPVWSPDGVLHFASDANGWWNLYAEDGGEVRAVCETDAELAPPQWIFGISTYAFLDDGRIAAVVTRRAIESLELIDPASRTLTPVNLPFNEYSAWSVAARGATIVTVAATATEGPAVVTIDVDSATFDVVRRETEADLDERFIAHAEPIAFAGDGGQSYAFYYAPTNPNFAAPEGELPPLVVHVHGGPTAHTTSALNLAIQFYTSRGIAYVDVNYGGSTGYGREFRERLRGAWGIVDVRDAEAAAHHLADAGRADPDRTLITGGSAGGYTTLMAMGVSDVFAAGVSEFGVADLVTFHGETHKFEAHYDEYLVGKWPEQEELYRERSPVAHADNISKPLLLLQGLDDKVVPPSQAEAIAAALDRNGVPYAYVAFAGEGHGFRGADARRRAFEVTLSFMSQVFGFRPADEIEQIDVANLQPATR
ncbi:MAG: S9 family peptidase [Acidobacteria bacterium]|nr:S9 family peptidase [Acidobacteriota bacterium]